MQEFRYGYERLRAEPWDPPSVARWFYHNSLMEYLYSLLLSNGAMARFRGFLTDWGLAHYADRLEEILGRKIGPKTLRERLLDYRGGMLGHFDFSGERVRRLRKEYETLENRGEYAAAMDELLSVVYQLAVGAQAKRDELVQEAAEANEPKEPTEG